MDDFGFHALAAFRSFPDILKGRQIFLEGTANHQYHVITHGRVLFL
jgi:hypothetical protein